MLNKRMLENNKIDIIGEKTHKNRPKKTTEKGGINKKRQKREKKIVTYEVEAMIGAKCCNIKR